MIINKNYKNKILFLDIAALIGGWVWFMLIIFSFAWGYEVPWVRGFMIIMTAIDLTFEIVLFAFKRLYKEKMIEEIRLKTKHGVSCSSCKDESTKRIFESNNLTEEELKLKSIMLKQKSDLKEDEAIKKAFVKWGVEPLPKKVAISHPRFFSFNTTTHEAFKYAARVQDGSLKEILIINNDIVAIGDWCWVNEDTYKVEDDGIECIYQIKTNKLISKEKITK